MKGLSVIIPSFNTKDMTLKCVKSLDQALETSRVPHEILVVDNASHDGSPLALSNLEEKCVKTILNKDNVGYGKANNQALRIARFDYILFLNSDVLMDREIDIASLVDYMDRHEKVGVLTVRVILPNGSIDPASHRGFPTLWRSFCYFAGLEKLFGKVPGFNRIFGGYHLMHLDRSLVHEIDSPTGAFYLTRLSLMKRLNGFDEDFFMYGEDLDLSYRVKELGYTVVYFPRYQVTHYKYQSGIKSKEGQSLRRKIRGYFYEAMATFYRKHYEKQHPFFVNSLVYSLIRLKSKII